MSNLHNPTSTWSSCWWFFRVTLTSFSSSSKLPIILVAPWSLNSIWKVLFSRRGNYFQQTRFFLSRSAEAESFQLIWCSFAKGEFEPIDTVTGAFRSWSCYKLTHSVQHEAPRKASKRRNYLQNFNLNSFSLAKRELRKTVGESVLFNKM